LIQINIEARLSPGRLMASRGLGRLGESLGKLCRISNYAVKNLLDIEDAFGDGSLDARFSRSPSSPRNSASACSGTNRIGQLRTGITTLNRKRPTW
jgi:hypothetical protein